MKSVLCAEHFHNEAAAFAYVEAKLWPSGPICPHCDTVDRAGRLKGKSVRPGLWKCYACRKQFTVRMRTVFESSHVPLHIWLQAFYLMCSSKKGISARQLQRTFGGSMKTAWFLGHRIREAMMAQAAQAAARERHRRSSADGTRDLGGIACSRRTATTSQSSATLAARSSTRRSDA